MMDKDRHFSNDIEKSGYLMKKTSKGLWVNRYFITEGNFLHYWHEHTDYEAEQSSSEKYDISEIKSIEKVSTYGIVMSFSDDNKKFKLEIKAAQVSERNDWYTLLDAKRKLYSVDELLVDLKNSRISFKTKTFQTLMMLSEREQNKWILDYLDESFETSTNNDSYIHQLRSSNNRLLLCACHAIDEFTKQCHDCVSEIASREPKIIAHSKNYMKRYCEILKGRMVLELLYLPGIERKQYELLEEKALCTALLLSNKIDVLSKFSFLPKEFFSTLYRTLFSTGDLLSALIKLSIHRIDGFFNTILNSTLDVRMKKMIEIQSVLNEFLQLIKDDLTDNELFQIVVEKVFFSFLSFVHVF
jgi:hypothetical protein